MKRDALPIIEWNPDSEESRVSEFLRRFSIDPSAEETARQVLAAIKRRGDAAVLEYVRQFDNSELSAEQLKVDSQEIAQAADKVDPDFKSAAQEACRRIERYARSGMRNDWEIETAQGGTLGEKWVPLQRVGAYIPGGTAPLASTALMTLTLARVAGVSELVACCPVKDGARINPYVLYALQLAGATEIYRVGGIQAIGAMAYGTDTIAKVQKIVGPGGPFVTAAKKLVYGEVALDMVAGPSEIAVLADETADPACVAADLLSQAEHGTGSEKALLVTPSRDLARNVRAEVLKQAQQLKRQDPIYQVLERGMLLAVVENIDLGIELCNRFAPEHLELIISQPRQWLPKIRTAGALFMGPWTPESVGDFVAGPSHVLPTGGTAAIFSGLSVDDFRRRMSTIEYTREDLEQALPVTDAFGRVETLDGHARSSRIRFERGGEE